MSISNNTNLDIVFCHVAGADAKIGSSSRSSNKKDLDQYYSPPEVFERAAEILKPYADQLNYCIDFSAGNGGFARTIQKINASIRFDQFDLFPSGEGIQQKDWFYVNPEEYAGQNVSLIGFNPPYGRRGQQAFKFIEHAQKFKPKFMVLLLPFNFEFPVLGYESLHIEAVDSRFAVPEGSETFRNFGSRFLDLSTKLHLFRKLEGEPSNMPLAQIASKISKHDLVDMVFKAFDPWSAWSQGIAIRHRGRNSGTEFYFKDKIMGLFFVRVMKQKHLSGRGKQLEPLHQMRSDCTFFKIQMLDSETSTYLQNYSKIAAFAKTFFDIQNGVNRMALTRPSVYLFCQQIRSINLMSNLNVRLPEVDQELILDDENSQHKISIYRLN